MFSPTTTITCLIGVAVSVSFLSCTQDARAAPARSARESAKQRFIGIVEAPELSPDQSAVAAKTPPRRGDTALRHRWLTRLTCDRAASFFPASKLLGSSRPRGRQRCDS